jgi:NTE family protein
MKRLLLCLVLVGQLFSAAGLLAAEPQARRPKVGLVLKGGGALGFAHVGVLKVLERNRIPVDLVAGTSMGSIVGAAYATGLDLDEMERTLGSTDWGALFGEKIFRQNIDYRLKAGRRRELFGDTKLAMKDGKLAMPQGVVEGQNIRLLFQELFGNPRTPINFDDLPLPYRAVTSDLETGEAYVPSSGDLAAVVRASMAVPGAFSPMLLDGRLLIDGGIANNLTVDVVLNMGADILIVVDLKCDLAKREDLTTPFSISGQMVSMLLAQNAALSLKLVRPQDIVVAPDVNGYTVTDFPKALELMAIGEKTAESMVSTLRRLSVSEAEYQTYLAKRTKRIPTPATIDFIRLKNSSPVSDGKIRHAMKIKSGDAFDPKRVEEDIQRIYQMGYFESVQYSTVTENGATGIEIDAEGKSWLSKYLRFGLALEDNLDGDDRFRLGAIYRSELSGPKGTYYEVLAEIGKTPRFALELYRPVAEDSEYFISPRLSVGRGTLEVSDGDTTIAEYSRTEGSGSLLVGRRLSTFGEATLGYTRGAGKLSREIGDSSLKNFSYDLAEVFVGLDYDTLDRPDFPTQGLRLLSKAASNEESLGAPSNFQEIVTTIGAPWTFNRHTLYLKNDFASTFGERPLERLHTLGGFLSVSGTLQNSLPASDYNSAGVIYFHRFSEVENPFVNLAFFIGGSYEMTTIHSNDDRFEDHSLIQSGSIYIGADTPIVPMYLGFGAADIGEESIYISIGRLGRELK